MSTVEVNGTTLYYEEAGEGPPMLFVHGMAGNADVWSDQMDRLSASFHTVAYDRRGHTRSPRGNVTEESVQLHADDVAGLIEALGLGPVILVGSSGGARIGIDVLRRHAPLVRAAVLSEPPAFSLSPAIGQEFLATVQPAVVRALDSEDPSSAVDAFFGVIDPEFWAGVSSDRRQRYRENLTAVLADLQGPPYQLTTADLALLRRPCLVISGSASLTWFRDIATIVAGAIPDATLLELDGASHATYASRPAEFALAVREFASRL